MLDFISDTEHFTKVLDLAAKAKETLWIGTADIKDLYVVQGKMAKPFLGVLSDLIGKGVEVRLIHAKEPGPNFREDFDRYPRLATMLERVMCPRVHFKILVIDQAVCYVGSANLTGAGMGMKSATRRNFEAGALRIYRPSWTMPPTSLIRCGAVASAAIANGKMFVLTPS